MHMGNRYPILTSPIKIGNVTFHNLRPWARSMIRL